MSSQEYYNLGNTNPPRHPSGPPPPYQPLSQQSQASQTPPPQRQHSHDIKYGFQPGTGHQQYYNPPPPPPPPLQNQPLYQPQQQSSYNAYRESQQYPPQQYPPQQYPPQQYPPPAETGSLRPPPPGQSYSSGPHQYSHQQPQYSRQRPASASPYLEKPSRHHHRSRSRSRSRSRGERSHHSHRRFSDNKPANRGTFDTFVGAGGGAIVGDLIFPGLGTVGGAILGGLGGHKVAQDKMARSQSGKGGGDRYDREYEAAQHRRGRN